MAELDRITSSLAINDPLKNPPQGQEGDPEEEEERNPFALGFRNLAARSGVEPTSLQRNFQNITSTPSDQVVQEEREKSNFFRKLMGRGPLGKVVDLPGPIDIYNPLKMGWNGLEAIHEHVANPLAGLAFGGASMAEVWVNNQTNRVLGFDGSRVETKAEKRRDEFKAALSHRGGGIRGLWQGAGDYTVERDSFFWGEKFVSSIIFDPTSYLGFGLLSKVPKVGVTGVRMSTRLPSLLGGFNFRTLSRVKKIELAHNPVGEKITLLRDKHGFVSKDNPARRRLASFDVGTGALEAGYVEAFNLPFRAAIAAYKSMPKSAQLLTKKTTRQSADEFGDLTHNIITENIVEAVGGGKNFKAISTLSWRQVWAERISNMAVRSAELTKSQAVIRNEMYGSQAVTPAMLVQLARKTKGSLALTDAKLAEQVGPQGIEFQGSILATLSEEFSKLVKMETSITEASEQIIRQSGGQHSKEVYAELESYLQTYTTAIHKNVENRVMNNTLTELRGLMVNDAINMRVTQIDAEIAKRRKGIMGAFLSDFDTFQKKFYQRGLRRHAIRPMGTAVLIFPGFPIQEFVEGSTRQIFGDSALGMRNSLQFDETLSFFGGGPLRIAELNAASHKTTESLTRVGGGGINEGSIGLQNEWLKGLSDTKIESIFQKGSITIQGEKFNWFNPVDYVRMTGAISGGIRRRFLMSRMYQRCVNYLAHEQPALVASIDKTFPDDVIQGSLVDVIHEAMVLRIMSGNSDAVRDLPRIFSQEVITTKEAMTIIDRIGADGQVPTVAMTQMKQWATESRRYADLPALLTDVLELSKDEYVKGFEGFLHGMRGMKGVLSQAKNDLKVLKGTTDTISQEEKAKIKDLSYHVYQSIDDMSHRLDGILQDTADRVNAKATLREKDAIWKDAHWKMSERMDEADRVMLEIKKELEAIEIDAFGQSYVAGHFEKEWKLTSTTWAEDREAMRIHFLNSDSRRKKSSFWEEQRTIRRDIWNRYRDRRMDLKIEGTAAQADMDKAVHGAVSQPKLIDADFKGRSLTMKDIGYIVGAGQDNMSQALIQGTIMTEEEFVKYVMYSAGKHNFKNVSERAVRQARRDLLNEIHLTDSIQTGQEAVANSIKNTFLELRGVASKQSWRDVHSEALQGYANGIADQMDELGGGFLKADLKREGKRILDDSMSDLNKAFVNYDGSTMIDDLAQGVFPFWVYESRRIPYLMRTGFQKPIIWSTIMPEGRYWEATDDGYIPVWAQKWMDMNIFGGTMFNTPRRFARAQFPEQHISGIQGAYSKAETQLGRYGFYFGTHISAIPEMVLPMMGSGTGDDRGELLPPLISGPASLVEMGANPLPGTQKHIPLLAPFSRGFGKLRRYLFPDRFREFFLGRILAERGLDVTELDWDTFEPKVGANTLTQSDINDAMALAAMQEWVSESTGNVRFEGPNKKQFDDQRDEFIADWTPLTVEQIRTLRKDGVNPTNLYPLPAPVRRIFDEIPNAVNFGLSSSRLSAGEVRAFEDHVSDFWTEVDSLRDQLAKDQFSSDTKWQIGVGQGGISPAAWRASRESRGGIVADTMNILRGKRRTPGGVLTTFDRDAEYADVPVSFEEIINTAAKFGNDSLRIRHPFDDLMARFFEIVPIDTDGDGFVNWNQFFNAREVFLDKELPVSLREVFQQELGRNLGEVEAELAKIQRTYLGEYWDLEDRVMKELGAEEIVRDVINAQRFDPFNAKFLRSDPLYKAYKRTLRQERQFARELNPRLDYALNIFGFTGQGLNFQSPIAEAWWESDGKRPMLNRLTR